MQFFLENNFKLFLIWILYVKKEAQTETQTLAQLCDISKVRWH